MSARRTPAADRGSVLFIHGLWMTGAESFVLRRHLAREGWTLRAFPYSSRLDPLDSVARRCARYARLLALRTRAPVHLLGHSLGGLVIYRMFELGLLAADRFNGDFCRVVLMGTPINGSRSGRVLAAARPGRALLGTTGCEVLAERGQRAWCHSAQIGIIAGDHAVGLGRLLGKFNSPSDGTVAVEETELPGASDHCVLPVSHTGMLWSADVAGQVANFLERGKFAQR